MISMTDIDDKRLDITRSNVLYLFGGNERQALLWWNHYNRELEAVPVNLEKDSKGIKKLFYYTSYMLQH